MKTLLLTLAVLVIGATIVMAQPAPMLPNAPAQAPIDGGLSLLAAGGAVYAYRKLRKNR
jgi:hypothetical protein